MRKSIRLLCLLFFSFSFTIAHAKDAIQLTIDSPGFRKLMSASPVFFVDKSIVSAVERDFASTGSEELERLLRFSGLFNTFDPKFYADALEKMRKTYEVDSNKDWLVELSTLKEQDWALWKTLGIEVLNLASLSLSSEGELVLVIKTFDVLGRREILAKKFEKITDKISTIRKYADFILEAYTGKTGIFSSKIAFVGRASKGAVKQVYIADFDGSNLKKVTNGSEPHLSPAWSPDGRYLTYSTFNNREPNIYVYDTLTSKTRQLTRSKGGVTSGAHWSPNGKLIAFSVSRQGMTDIQVISPEGNSQRMLIKGSSLDVDPKFSPDASKLAFVSGRYGNPHIFVADLKWDSQTQVRVTGDKRLTYAGWYNSTPDWSPDSKKIAFAGYDRDINRYDVFMMNPDGSKLERLTLERGDNINPSWSPNGQLIAFESNRVGNSNAKGVSRIWIMSADGSEQRPIEISGVYEASTPAWSPQQ